MRSLIYGLFAWRSTYSNILNTLVVLEKKVVRIISFCMFDSFTSPLFYELLLLKLPDLIFLQRETFNMFDFHYNMTPPAFYSRVHTKAHLPVILLTSMQNKFPN